MSDTALAPVVPATAGRVRVVAVLLAVGTLVTAAMVLWQPFGERDAFGYDDLAAHRDAGWLGSLLDGVAFGVVGVTLGLVVCLLAPGRGAVWALVGAVLTGLGGLLFAAGMLSMGTVAWYTTALDAGREVWTFADGNPGRLMGAQMAGFLLFTVGSLVLMVALWRSRSVPRWLPVAVAVLTVGVFVLDGVFLNVLQAAQLLLLAVPGYFLLTRD